MKDRVVDLFENILDQKKNTKQTFVDNERKELLKRLEDMEERSTIVKSIIQEAMGIDQSTSTDTGASSNKILELLAYENQLLSQSIDHTKKQNEKALKEAKRSEKRAQELKSKEKIIKKKYSGRIAELQELNRQKEASIQEIDMTNAEMHREVKQFNEEIKKNSADIDPLQLLNRKKDTIIDIIEEIIQETDQTKGEIAYLKDVYRKLINNWRYLNSLMAEPNLPIPCEIGDLEEEEDSEEFDFQELLAQANRKQLEENAQEKWQKEFEKQFIKLETLKEELNAANTLGDQLKMDNENMSKTLRIKNRFKQEQEQAKSDREHARSKSNPFDYVIKPAFSAHRKEVSEEFNLSNLVENQSDIGSIDNESMNESFLEIFS